MEHDFAKRMERLGKILALHQDAYYRKSRPLVSDAEYDRLFDELLSLEKAHPELADPNSPTSRVGSDLGSDFPEFTHTIPVLSLDKVYSSATLLSWIEKCEQKQNNALSFVIEEKIDGISMVLYYQKGVLARAVTRGNGIVGNEVTANVRTIGAVPLKLAEPVDIVVRGEVYLGKDEFERVNKTLEEPYANPRNLAAGTVRRQRSSEAARIPLSMFCYEGYVQGRAFADHLEILAYLRSLGFRTDPNIGFFCAGGEEAARRLAKAGLDFHAGSFDDIPAYIEAQTQGRRALSYEIDGLVCKVNEIGVREVFGYTGHHPRWAMAYKFEAPQAQTVVEAIDVQVGRTGRITPMARVVPARLGGSVIANITLHNQDYIDQLELAVGDTVAISKRGDVIPAVEAVVEKNEAGNTTWAMPRSCPSCHTPLVRIGAHHFCPNHDCPLQAKGRLSFFVGKGQMDIEGLGPETAAFLYDNGYIKEIDDLFTFDWGVLNGLRGFGDKKVRILRNSIRRARSTPFRQVLAALGIPEFGRKAVDSLCDAGLDTMDKLLDVADRGDKERLLEIDQIGEKLASLLIDSLNSPHMRRLIGKLREAGLCMEDAKKAGGQPRPLEGQSWCITGSFDGFASRDEVAALLAGLGARTVSSVSSRTSVLLVGRNPGSKLAKARELGVRLADEAELRNLAGAAPRGGEAEQGELF